MLDTNVLIRIWRANAGAVQAVYGYRCGIETIACAEFLQGVNYRQRDRADEFIRRFVFIPFSPAISYRALGLRMADALIAATAVEDALPLVTFNKKHFNFIEGIRLV